MQINKLIETRKSTYIGLFAMAFFLIASLWGGTAQAEYKIGASDVLSISVFGEDDLKRKIRVSADGRITFPLIGVLHIADQSTFQVEKLIADKLVTGGFVRSAQVIVNVLDYNSQRVSVLGYVNQPGRYSLESANTLLDIIALAGGIKDSGSEQIIITSYKGEKVDKQIVTLNALFSSSANVSLFEVHPGDVIYVPKAPLFYIYGQVERPGGYPVEHDLTVAKALSIGGGLTPRGTQRGIVIKRNNVNGIVEEIDVGLSDSVLKDDVLFIDERLF